MVLQEGPLVELVSRRLLLKAGLALGWLLALVVGQQQGLGALQVQDSRQPQQRVDWAPDWPQHPPAQDLALRCRQVVWAVLAVLAVAAVLQQLLAPLKQKPAVLRLVTLTSCKWRSQLQLFWNHHWHSRKSRLLEAPEGSRHQWRRHL